MVIWLILPMVVCIALDLSLGLLPWLTLSASFIVLPLASVMVTRTALFEFDKVIQEVAPDEVEPDEIEPDDSWPVENDSGEADQYVAE